MVRFFFNCQLSIICFPCQKHFGWTCGAILKYPNFDWWYPQSAVFGIFWGQITAYLLLNVYNWTWHNVPIILGIVFGWFSFFWFRSSSSRTRARPVWSLRDKRATSHHHRQWHQLQTDQTSNSSSSGSRWAREEPKKVFGEKILKPPVRGYSISVYRFRGYPPSPFADQFLKGYLEGPLGRWFQGMHLKLKR